jgi:hypothetical protein
MYYFGVGIKQDKAVGEAWYVEGVKLRDPFAEFDLGSLLSVNPEHPHDLPRAVKLLRQAAEAGFVPAMHTLGLLLTNHPELTDSRQEARQLLEAAANAGSWKSSAVLGILARDKVGDSPGPESAFYHFQIAILQGGEAAKRLLSNDLMMVTRKLTEERKDALASEANAWFGQHKTALAFVFKDAEHEKRFPASALTVAPEGIHAGMLVPLRPSERRSMESEP